MLSQGCSTENERAVPLPEGAAEHASWLVATNQKEVLSRGWSRAAEARCAKTGGQGRPRLAETDTAAKNAKLRRGEYSHAENAESAKNLDPRLRGDDGTNPLQDMVPRRRGRLSAGSHSKGRFATVVGAQPGEVT